MTETPTHVAIGIDLGGTDIKSGLVTPHGTIVKSETIPTEANKGVDHVISRIVGLIESHRQCVVSESLHLDGVGVGSPGTLSHERGIVIAPPNLPNWRNVPMADHIEARIGLRPVLENDANAAALAEFRCGAGRGCDSMVMLTLGTGIGSGIIVDSQLFRGSNDNAGELGHMIVELDGRPCNCGQRGCLEAYASASGTAARARERIDAGEASSLASIVAQGREIDATMVADAARAGDALAQRVWRETCRYLAIGCINIVRAFDPERIILSGGMSRAGDHLLRPVIAGFDAMASDMLGDRPEIRIAELGNDAGLVGAALNALRSD